MATLLTITINTGSASQGQTRRAECDLLAFTLMHISHALQASQTQTGSPKDQNGVTVGSYTYTPVASA